MTEILLKVTDRELLRRAVASMRLVRDKRQLQKPRWSAVMDMFGLGSTYARIVCVDLGFDPDEKGAPMTARNRDLPPAKSDWQPIETAPKDGTEIILFGVWPDGKPRVSAGHWEVTEQGEYVGDCGGECRCPEYGDTPRTVVA